MRSIGRNHLEPLIGGLCSFIKARHAVSQARITFHEAGRLLGAPARH